jgi:hypothetical protein
MASNSAELKFLSFIVGLHLCDFWRLKYRIDLMNFNF